MRRIWALVALAAVVVVAQPGAEQNSNGLPDKDAFLSEARRRIVSNEILQNRYTYRERVTRMRFNPLGHIGTGPVDVYEVYPIAQGLTYRRLLERNGSPIPAAELAQADREFMSRYEEWRRMLQREDNDERAARLRRLTAEREKDRARAEEALGVFDFSLERRDTLEGQPVIVVSFRPRPNTRPQSREAKIASNFVGQAYVHEREYQVVRVEAEAIADTSFAWLPVETRMNGTGRALLFRKVTIDYVREYSDYQPFEPSDLAMRLSSARSRR
jgi:hypothetical protein